MSLQTAAKVTVKQINCFVEIAGRNFIPLYMEK